MYVSSFDFPNQLLIDEWPRISYNAIHVADCGFENPWEFLMGLSSV